MLQRAESILYVPFRLTPSESEWCEYDPPSAVKETVMSYVKFQKLTKFEYLPQKNLYPDPRTFNLIASSAEEKKIASGEWIVTEVHGRVINRKFWRCVCVDSKDSGKQLRLIRDTWIRHFEAKVNETATYAITSDFGTGLNIEKQVVNVIQYFGFDELDLLVSTRK